MQFWKLTVHFFLTSQLQRLENSHQPLFCWDTEWKCVKMKLSHNDDGSISAKYWSVFTHVNSYRLPYLLLESAATEKPPDQGLDVGCCLLLVLLSSPLLPGLPGFVQEVGLGALRNSKHCAAWKSRISLAVFRSCALTIRMSVLMISEHEPL